MGLSKRICLLLLFALTLNAEIAYSQNLIYNSDSSGSLLYNKKIINQYPDSFIALNAWYRWYNLARQKNDTPQTIQICHCLLNFNFNKQQINKYKSSYYPLGFNECSVFLGEYFKKLKNYDSAIYYYYLADQIYKFNAGGCANGILASKLRYADTLANLYLAWGDIKMAMAYLLREAFNSEHHNAYDNDLKQLRTLLLEFQSIDNLQNGLNKSINDYRITNNGFYSISFFGQMINTYYYNNETEKLSAAIKRENFMKAIKDKPFYKLIMME